jgi:2'-5' RNA ligase
MSEDWEDDDFDHQYDDFEDDPNLYLPNYFITCFDPSQLDRYKWAINEYAKIVPEHGLEIDMSGAWNDLKNPALLFFGERGEDGLTAFWNIFESFKQSVNELEASL